MKELGKPPATSPITTNLNKITDIWRRWAKKVDNTINLKAPLNNRGIDSTNSVVAWDDLRSPSSAASTPSGKNVPSDTEIGSTGVFVKMFDNQTAPNEEELEFIMQLPHSYKPGSNVRIHIHTLNETSPASDVNVVWLDEYW